MWHLDIFLILRLIYAALGAVGFVLFFRVVFSSFTRILLSAFTKVMGEFWVFILGHIFVFGVFIFVVMLLGGILAIFINGLWVHLWVYLLGGRGGIRQTLKAIMYASTPQLLLGWIPFFGYVSTIWSIVLPTVGYVSAIWGIVLSIVGIHRLQRVSIPKAIFVVVLAVLSAIIIILFFYLAFFFSGLLLEPVLIH